MAFLKKRKKKLHTDFKKHLGFASLTIYICLMTGLWHAEPNASHHITERTTTWDGRRRQNHFQSLTISCFQFPCTNLIFVLQSDYPCSESEFNLCWKKKKKDAYISRSFSMIIKTKSNGSQLYMDSCPPFPETLGTICLSPRRIFFIIKWYILKLHLGS